MLVFIIILRHVSAAYAGHHQIGVLQNRERIQGTLVILEHNKQFYIL
jgi:hypothetical protein